MDLERKRITTCAVKGQADTQLTLEEDFIVPDALSDLEKMIAHREKLVIENTKCGPESVTVRGKLCFVLLYAGPEESRNLHSLDGQIPFTETIHMEGVREGETCEVTGRIEDFTLRMIHSRKVCARALLTLEAEMDASEDREAVSLVRSEPGIYMKKMTLEHADSQGTKRDICRVKEDIELEKGRQGIQKILWNQVDLRGMETKLFGGKLVLSGELLVFVLYSPEDADAPLQWFESSIPFTGQVDAPDAEEDGIQDIRLSLLSAEVTEKPDFDGEMRSVDIDAVIDVRMKIYRPKETELLADVYSLKKTLHPKIETICYEKIHMKNSSRKRISDKIRTGGAGYGGNTGTGTGANSGADGSPAEGGSGMGAILQICHAEGSVSIDEITPTDQGIEVEGVLKAGILCATSDDHCPLAMIEGILPFQHTIDVTGMDTTDTTGTTDSSAGSAASGAGKSADAEPQFHYEITPSLEQLTAQPAGDGEIVIKAVVALDALVLGRETADVIMDVKEEPLDFAALEAMPGMTGYLVKEGETLWDIAKRYHTSEERIMEINERTSPEVREGDRLLLVKEAAE